MPETDPVVLALAAVRRLPPHPIVLIDGPSGAGKSTLANAVMAAWPSGEHPILVRMDDLYPGWSGLDAASESVSRDLVEPIAAGRGGQWHRWDWVAGRRASVETVVPGRPLILEGCGALSRRAARVANLSLYLDSDEDLRRHRALTRDAGGFDEHWKMWQQQFDAYAARERPRAAADLVLDGFGGSLLRGTALDGMVLGGMGARGRYGGRMTDTAGSDYIAEYTDGPLAGQIEHRTLDESGETEKTVNAMVAVNGLETILEYHAVDRRDVEGMAHVAFSFDKKNSDTIQPDEDDVNDETASSI